MGLDLERKQFIFNQLGYKPHSAKQQAVHDSQARFRVLACGRRWGKTTFGANELTAQLLDPERAGVYWIVGPKYSAAEKEFRIVYFNLLRKLKFRKGRDFTASYNAKQGDMRIEFKPTGAILECKSAQHKDTLLGEGVAGVIMAEAARHDTDTWEQYVRPALSDFQPWGERGWGIFTSTPRGYNWFQGLYLMGLGLNPNYESWCLPSWENPIVYPGGRTDPEILDIENNKSNQWFEQEIAALFTAFTGKIYTDFSPEIHVRPVQYDPRLTNVWALDYGFTNPFCCYDVMIGEDDTFKVWREYQVSGVATHEHADILMKREQPQGYHVDWGAGDPRGPDASTTLSSLTGVQIHSEDIADEGDRHSSWELGVEAVRSALKIRPTGLPGLIIDPSCTDLIRQMEQLRAPEETEGKNNPEGQHKYDDHGPDAIRYLIGQYVEGGAGASLSDIYSHGQATSEAATFFQNNVAMDRYARF